MRTATRILSVLLCAGLLSATSASAQGAKDQGKATEKASKSATKSQSDEGAKAQSGKGFDTSAPSSTEVKASTGTKPSPVGQPVTDYKPPAAKSLKIKEPPAPPKK